MPGPTGSAAIGNFSITTGQYGGAKFVEVDFDGTLTAIDGDQAGGTINVFAEFQLLCSNSQHTPVHSGSATINIGQTNPGQPLTKTFNTGKLRIQQYNISGGGPLHSGQHIYILCVRAVNNQGQTIFQPTVSGNVIVP